MHVEVCHAPGQWKAIPPPDEFLYWDPKRYKDETWMREMLEDEPALAYQWRLGRNYNLFAILANVRNGFGFGGVDTGDGFVPIAEPRGLPDDLSPELASMRVEHDPSHLFWTEVAEYPHWRAGITVHRGTVDAYNYKHWVEELKREGRPVSFSGGVAGPGIRYVKQAALDSQLQDIPAVAIDDLIQPFPKHHPMWDGIYTVVEWKGTYREAAGSEWWRFFEIVQGFAIDPRHLRLVFYFDS